MSCDCGLWQTELSQRGEGHSSWKTQALFTQSLKQTSYPNSTCHTWLDFSSHCSASPLFFLLFSQACADHRKDSFRFSQGTSCSFSILNKKTPFLPNEKKVLFIAALSQCYIDGVTEKSDALEKPCASGAAPLTHMHPSDWL